MSIYSSLENRNVTTEIQPRHTYLGYFNHMQYISSGVKDAVIVLYNQVQNYSKFMYFKEYKAIVNKALKLFGRDIELKGEYSEKDTEEIKSGVWAGRSWRFERLQIILEINSGSECLNLFLYVTE